MIKRILFIFLILTGFATSALAERIALNEEWQYAIPPQKSEFTPENKDLVYMQLENRAGLTQILPNGGFLVLQTHFKISQELRSNHLGLLLGRVVMAERTYINGIYIGGTGVFPPDNTNPWSISRMYSVPDGVVEEGSNKLTVFIYFSPIRGGIFDLPYIGERHDIKRFNDIKTMYYTDFYRISSVISIFAALLFLIIFAKRRMEKHYLYFSLSLLLFSIWGTYHFIWSIPYLADLHFFDSLMYNKIAWLSLFLHTFFIIYFIKEFFQRTSVILTRVVFFTAGLSVLVILAAPSNVLLESFRKISLAVVFLNILICIYWMICAVKEKMPYVNQMIFFLIVASLLTIFDVLVDILALNLPYLTPVAEPLFLCGITAILINRFVNVYNEVELISSELDCKNIEITQKNRELSQLDLIKDEFLANTSHELRTPLHGIIGIAESLTDGAKGQMTDDMRHDLSLIVKSGRRLSSLIDDILDFSKIRNNNLQLSFGKVDLSAAVSLTFDLVRPLADKKGLFLKAEIPENARYVYADENRLIQILLNLIGNSIKFTHKGGITITAKTGSEDTASCVMIKIADTGIGIKPDDQTKIFNAFEQADGSISRSYGGTGLGLAIVKQLTQLHGGSITVESEQGQGSVFTVSLKCADAETALSIGQYEMLHKKFTYKVSAITPSSATLINNNTGTGNAAPYILVVDDDEVNIKILENILFSKNYEVRSSMDGTLALESIILKKPDLVILDVMMPNMSGFECVEKIRNTYSHADLPVIMITAKNRNEDIVCGFTAGANDYITKPFEKSELLARVKTHLQVKDASEIRSRLLAMEKQIEIARRIQLFTIPASIPAIPGLEVAARYLPMDSVGGDFYNFKIIDDNRVSFFIADVSGHGISASIIASMVHIGFNTMIDIFHDPLEFMTRLRTLMDCKIERHFITAACCAIDKNGQTVTYVRAGHMPLKVLNRKTSDLTSYLPKGSPIGFPRDLPFTVAETSFIPGDRLVLYTDGIEETRNEKNEFFGMDRFDDILRNTTSLSADETCSSIVHALQHWRGCESHFDDDITLVIIDRV